MPRPSKQQLEDFWNFADKNNDGTLTIHEFKAAVVHYSNEADKPNCQPPSDRDIADLFASLDNSDDLKLTKDEYLGHVDKQERNRENLTKGFQDFDKDGSGKLSREELTEIMLKSGFTQAHVDACIEEADKDGDGAINFEEFMNVM